jgi:uncharacterized SAM-binding protein YcdF (DUF218 family)
MVLKKLIGACLLPFPLAVLAIVIGLLLLWLTQRQRLGRVAVSIGTFILLLGGYDILSVALIPSLERHYGPLTPPALAEIAPAPAAVVVLGSGYHPDFRLPANDRLSAAGLVRLIEAVRLMHLLPAARLVLSDGFGQGEALLETAAFLGVPRERIALEARSLDTADEAALLRPLVGAAPFLLVTSAAHMRRAMALCQKQGLNPIAAPADFSGGSNADGFLATDLIPHASGFARADQALHEWIGLGWSGLRGKI